VDDPLGVGGDQLHEWAFVDDAPEVDRRFRKRGTEGIEAALDRARAAAGGQDVRLGGGVATAQEYLRAGLVDELHVVVVPVLLHGGEPLFDNLDGSLEGMGVRRGGTVPVGHPRPPASSVMARL
jgi:hypothetical protein